jgi:hypothetical protein
MSPCPRGDRRPNGDRKQFAVSQDRPPRAPEERFIQGVRGLREARASMSIASWPSRDWGPLTTAEIPISIEAPYQQPDPVARRMVPYSLRFGQVHSDRHSRVVSSSTPIVVLAHSCRSATTVNYASSSAQSLTIEMEGLPALNQRSVRPRSVVRITVRRARIWWALFELPFRALGALTVVSITVRSNA